MEYYDDIDPYHQKQGKQLAQDGEGGGGISSSL